MFNNSESCPWWPKFFLSVYKLSLSRMICSTKILSCDVTFRRWIDRRKSPYWFQRFSTRESTGNPFWSFFAKHFPSIYPKEKLSNIHPKSEIVRRTTCWKMAWPPRQLSRGRSRSVVKPRFWPFGPYFEPRPSFSPREFSASILTMFRDLFNGMWHDALRAWFWWAVSSENDVSTKCTKLVECTRSPYSWGIANCWLRERVSNAAVKEISDIVNKSQPKHSINYQPGSSRRLCPF